MNDTYIITFYELGKNDFTTETVEAKSFEDALEYARKKIIKLGEHQR